MRFVCKLEDTIEKALMAHIFLTRMVKENRIQEVCNMDEVIAALDPIRIVEAFVNEIKEN